MSAGRVRQWGRFGTLPFSILLLAILCYIGYLAFWPKPPAKPDQTWTRIQNERVLRIGIDPSFPPFAVDDGKGNLSGFDIALAELLAQKWGAHLQYVYTGYDGLYDALAGNQFDLILSALTYDPNRTQDVLYSHSYFDGGPVLVARPGGSSIKGLADLAGRSAAVELGTSGDDFIRHWERRLRLDRRIFNTSGEALTAVARGQVSAAVVDPISFYDFDRSNPGLAMIGGPLANEYYLIAVRRNSPTLLQQINAVIDGARRDGILKQLQAKWF